MRITAVFALAAALVACAPASAAETFVGTGKGIDGDSLYVGDHEVRLFGIDAPEWTQSCTRDGRAWACGEAAAAQLARLVNGRKVICSQVDTDKHGRAVARCQAGAVDLNRAMVSSGFATAFRQYSTDYVAAEAAAKGARRGIWAGTFVNPQDVRHAADASSPAPRRSASTAAPRRARQPASSDWQARASGNCTIKGNRGSNGWIYHVPGMPYYERTRPEELFCNESDAQAAGYRRAKVR